MTVPGALGQGSVETALGVVDLTVRVTSEPGKRILFPGGDPLPIAGTRAMIGSPHFDRCEYVAGSEERLGWYPLLRVPPTVDFVLQRVGMDLALQATVFWWAMAAGTDPHPGWDPLLSGSTIGTIAVPIVVQALRWPSGSIVAVMIRGNPGFNLETMWGGPLARGGWRFTGAYVPRGEISVG